MNKVSERLWKKAGLMRLPLAGSFELLPVCNLHCKMCYVRKSMEEVREQGGLLSTERWLQIAGEARDEGLLYPLITGGEPLLRKDFQEILAKMQEMGLQVSINSNGTLINEDMARWLGEHRPTRMNITLYGASEESYQNMCGDGDAFNRVIQAVGWLKHYGVPVKFSCSITRENLHDMEKIMEYAKIVQSPIQVATYMFPPVRRNPGMPRQNYRLSPEEAAKARVKADLLQNEPEWFVKQAKRFLFFVEPTEELFQNIGRPVEREMTCRAGRCTFWIDWQGNMSNCGIYSSVRFPMKRRCFADCWRQLVTETDKIRYVPPCTVCPNAQLCHTCIAMTYTESGNLYERPDYLCRYNKESARLYKLCAGELENYRDPIKILEKQ